MRLGVVVDRFIPAGAGNRGVNPARIHATPVHPRGCGEQRGVALTEPDQIGSSPRVRGTAVLLTVLGVLDRFIPAGAGNRSQQAPCSSAPTVHPRGCGEQIEKRSRTYGKVGSSPRVRGTAAGVVGHDLLRRFIPAGAGNRLKPTNRRPKRAVHPRGCGEQGRNGKLKATDLRFIPAGAGNRCSGCAGAARATVHPRGCGEQLPFP